MNKKFEKYDIIDNNQFSELINHIIFEFVDNNKNVLINSFFDYMFNKMIKLNYNKIIVVIFKFINNEQNIVVQFIV